MIRVVLVLLALILMAQKSQAQTVTLKGRIVSEEKEGLPGAGIRSELDNNIGTTADENGRFEITVEKHDTLIVTYIGFIQNRIAVVELEGESLITMKPVTQVIEAIEVTAERIIAEEFTMRKIKKL